MGNQVNRWFGIKSFDLRSSSQPWLLAGLEVGLVDGMIRRVKARVGTLAAYDPDKTRVRA